MTRAMLAALILLAWALPGWAQSERIPVEVLVTHHSNQGRGIDPSAQSLDKRLRPAGIAFDSIRVLKRERMNLTLDEVSRFQLPNGKAVRMRPIHKGAGGVLMAVDVEGAAKLDARMQSHKPVVIRAGPHQKGHLVVSIELED